jgi:hypothetical protein
MLNEKTLLDSWVATGKTYEDFKTLLTELSDCTNFVQVDPVEISVLSLMSLNEEKARFYDLQPCNTGGPQEKPCIRSLPISKVLAKGSHEQLLKETFETVKALFFSDGNVFFPAERIMTRSLCQFGAGGLKMGTPSYERDLYISSLFKDAQKSTFVIREIAGVKKLVAILSARYQALPQSALCEIIDALAEINDFGKMETYLWMMTNWTSDIYLEFPEKAEEIQSYYELPDDFIPGFWLRTSDTGDSSVKVYPTWRRGRSISYVEESAVIKVHSGKIELSDIIKDVVEKAFKEYVRLPEAMCNLMTQSITDDSLDLTTPKGVAKNKEDIAKVIKNAFRSLNIVKAIGKGHTKALYEQLCAEFSGSIRYTAYDIATAILSMPERLEGIGTDTKHNLESAVSGAPYIKYFISKEESAEDLILV